MTHTNNSNDIRYVFVYDGDMLVYRAAAAAEYEVDWGDGLWTLHSFLDDAILNFKEMLNEANNKLLAHLGPDILFDGVVIAFSDSCANFRKDLLPDYKGNRAGKRKPVCYRALREWVESMYSSVCYPDLEADDAMSILATSPNKLHKCILVSGDKDFKTVPCDFYDFLKDSFVHISERDAMRNHALQTLTGDVADNYKGCPGYGPVKAKRLLDKVDDADVWDTVIKAYLDAGLTAEDALVQARVAYLLRYNDFKIIRNEGGLTAGITLWRFPNNCQCLVRPTSQTCQSAQ